jgi:rhodanese-related sulfurtransferase
MSNIEVRSISCLDLAKSKDNTLLLDVRTPAEFGDAHIEGAVLHPLSDLDAQVIQQLAAGKDRCIVVCRSGTRARQAAEKLVSRISNLLVLEGGVSAWESAGLPLIRGKKAISLERQVRIAAGALVVLGTLLGTFVSSIWYILSAFIGVGLVFSGVTDTCGMAMVLARMPWNKARGRV